ncbi:MULTISPECIES: helix-turn-helix transcriptional regulator [unclassified Streptomyces]|uniref:helix-turn-helix domain-containing protein n=1 Tax=unclassified Streptomyces TaxID=2593676 RepID=UPI00101D1EA2|nr:helix-turn-helix transcriptional regulator [Streptomyces sp. L-9-10]
MASAKRPTSRQVRLGSELRKLREAVPMSGAKAASFLGGERSLISHVEAGRWGIKPERVQFLASHYGATDKDLVDALVAMARERGDGWWERFHGLLPPILLELSEIEHHATFLRTAQALIVPGIFQTEEYAHAVFSTANPGASADELSARIQHRQARREIFDRERPTPYEAIVHEAALRINYGSRRISRDQLTFLLEASDWPGVSIRVIPFTAESFIGFVPQMFYAGGSVPQLDTVIIESVLGLAFMSEEDQLRKYRSLFDAFTDLSLDIDESKTMINRILKEG